MIAAYASLSLMLSFFGKKYWVMGFYHRPKRALGVDKQFRWFYMLLLFAWLVGLGSFFLFTRTEITCDHGPYQNGEIPRETIQDYWDNAPESMVIAIEWAENAIWFAFLALIF